MEFLKEQNPFLKKWRKGLKRVALVYPNKYRSGISNIGLQYIYAKINSLDDFICERFYSDVYEGIRSLETGTELKDFDIAFFSLQFEEDYFKAIDIIKKSNFKGVKIAGGPCVMENPKPLLNYFDAFFIGEVEEVLEDLLEAALNKNFDGLRGVYTGKEDKVKRVYPRKLNEHLHVQIFGEGVYGRSILLEVGRGCSGACKFCMVRQIYFPQRWRDLDLLLEVVERNLKVTRKVALIAPSVTGYPRLRELLQSLLNFNCLISPSSLRADQLDLEILEILANSGLKSITLAPETGNEELRELIGKHCPNDVFIEVAEQAAKLGIKQMKLYFLFGLPCETMEHLNDTIRFVERIKRIIKVHVSVNPLVPKPHTPFQWLAFGGYYGNKAENISENLAVLKKKEKYLKKELGKLGIEAKFEKIDKFALQTVLSRGNTDISSIFLEKPIRIEKYGKYLSYFQLEEDLPWDFIDHGYTKRRLIKEFEPILYEVRGVN